VPIGKAILKSAPQALDATNQPSSEPALPLRTGWNHSVNSMVKGLNASSTKGGAAGEAVIVAAAVKPPIVESAFGTVSVLQPKMQLQRSQLAKAPTSRSSRVMITGVTQISCKSR
jgi:hypothetical protein